MPIPIVPGFPYRSAEALRIARSLAIGDQAVHETPDGCAVLAPYAEGSPPLVVNGSPVAVAPPSLVLHVLRADGLNLEEAAMVGGNLVVRTVKIDPAALPDLARLVEYDHLPEARKDHSAYPPGHKIR